MRYSKQRECILNYLKSVTSHPTAEAVYAAVRQEIPNISLGTVYRDLKQLKDSGDIITIESALGRINYDGCTDPHQHFICSGCGRIIDLNLTSHIDECKEQGLEIERETTVLYGRCRDCNNIK